MQRVPARGVVGVFVYQLVRYSLSRPLSFSRLLLPYINQSLLSFNRSTLPPLLIYDVYIHTYIQSYYLKFPNDEIDESISDIILIF